MSIFDAFARLLTGAPRPEPAMRVTSRGEGITYRIGGREVEIGIMPGKPPRLLAGSFDKWSDGQGLTDEEKSSVFTEALAFIQQRFREKATVVINRDDLSSSFWELLCTERRDQMAGIEYTSDREQFSRVQSLVESLPRGKVRVIVDDKEISDPAAVPDALAALRAKRRREGSEG